MSIKWNMTKKRICAYCPQHGADVESFKVRKTVAGSTEAFPVFLSNAYLITMYGCGLERSTKKDNETYTMGENT